MPASSDFSTGNPAAVHRGHLQIAFPDLLGDLGRLLGRRGDGDHEFFLAFVVISPTYLYPASAMASRATR